MIHTMERPQISQTAGTFERLKQEFAAVSAEFNQSPAMKRFASGQMGVSHYKEILKQVYFYTRENPQIQALASVHFRGSDRDLVRMFFKHAVSEIGHDKMALSDLASLGEDPAPIPNGNPLPATRALTAFVFYEIQFGNPIAYLGYLYFLEFLPTGSGGIYMRMLENLGVPLSAMSFLQEHVSVDVQHNKLMERYAERIIQNEADYDAVVYAMRVTGQLYADMLAAALEQADNPKSWGIAHREVSRRPESVSEDTDGTEATDH